MTVLLISAGALIWTALIWTTAVVLACFDREAARALAEPEDRC